MKSNRPFFLFCMLFFSLAAAGAPQEPAATQETPSQSGEPGEIQLTLQQAIEMALENNLNVVVSRLDTQVQAEGVASAKGVYKPFISANLNNLDSRSPAQNPSARTSSRAPVRTTPSPGTRKSRPAAATTSPGRTFARPPTARSPGSTLSMTPL
jgi:outer membrane protein TolC